eukprot:PITA_25080
MEFCITLVTALLFVVLVAAWSNLSRKRKGRLPPGPFSLPIIGNLHMLGKIPHRSLAALSMKYGPLLSLRLGSTLALVVSSPEIASEFLKTHDQLFASRIPSAAIKQLTYNLSGLIFSPYGPSWRQVRKLCVLHLLNPKRLDYFRFIREEEVSAMIRAIIIPDHSRPINISQTVSSFATAIICRMAFSTKYCDQDLINFSRMVKESFLLMGTFNIGDYVPYLDWMDLQGVNRRLKSVHKAQDYFLEKVIDEHAARNDPNAPKDLVDVLLAEAANQDVGLQISRDWIKAVLYDLLLAGSDTSQTIIEWAMSEALRNPSVLKKLQDELERVVGLGRMVRESDLPRLVYLQAVVKETLRLYPQGPILFRHLSSEPCNVLGYEIPQNTQVLVNIWAIGRNSESWEDAGSFTPERFMERVGSEVDTNGDQNSAWLPFGAGRRRCPGQQLGTLVAEIGLAQLLHCFKWRLPGADLDGPNQELDMMERFNGITSPRAKELFAIPTPRLECMPS